MPELYDGDGNLVDALSLEEVEEKLEAVKTTTLEDAKKEYEGELELLQKRIDEKDGELEKISKKDINFENLRKIKEDLEKKLTEKEQEFNSKFDELKNQTAKQKLDTMVDAIADGDTDLKDKIIYHYNLFAGTPENDAEMKQRLANAHLLATGPKSSVDSKVFATGTNSGSGEVKTSGKQLSADAKKVLPSMGITDEDIQRAEKQGLI